MPADGLVRNVVTFGRVLREAGLDVGTTRICDALEGLAHVGLAERDDVYWALRTTMVSRAEDVDVFDQAFAAWFLDSPSARPSEPPPPPLAQHRAATAPRPAAAERDEAGTDVAEVGWSAREVLMHRDFGVMTDEELAALPGLIARIAAVRPQRVSRRLRPHPSGTVLDLRRLMRDSLATGGEPMRRRYRRRVPTPRKLVALCDVSGSMERYMIPLLLFLHALAASGPRVEVLAFGTRLTRLTPELRSRDPERALAAAGAGVVDWAGGTRIGSALDEFNRVWGRRGFSRGAVVLIASDGWERHDPALVGTAMAELAGMAHSVIWVNPLKGNPEYQPLAGGMRAALPHIDRFLPGHDLASLEQLAGVLAGIERRHAG